MPRFDAQGVGDLLDIGQGDVPDAALHGGDICPVQLALKRELFLGEVALEAEIADVMGERPPEKIPGLADLWPCHSLGHAASLISGCWITQSGILRADAAPIADRQAQASTPYAGWLRYNQPP